MSRHGDLHFPGLQPPEDALEVYVAQHTSPENDYLYRLYRATNIHTIHGRMASGHV